MHWVRCEKSCWNTPKQVCAKEQGATAEWCLKWPCWICRAYWGLWSCPWNTKPVMSMSPADVAWRITSPLACSALGGCCWVQGSLVSLRVPWWDLNKHCAVEVTMICHRIVFPRNNTICTHLSSELGQPHSCVHQLKREDQQAQCGWARMDEADPLDLVYWSASLQKNGKKVPLSSDPCVWMESQLDWVCPPLVSLLSAIPCCMPPSCSPLVKTAIRSCGTPFDFCCLIHDAKSMRRSSGKQGKKAWNHGREMQWQNRAVLLVGKG